jgi:crotonobetainyl-CoA:carnitine CoA-transferase CaiB-like acyl-CoA transferase
MLESAVNMLTIPLSEFSADAGMRWPNGNRSSEGCPSGVFPCDGRSRWIAITVRNDDEWIRLCNVLGRDGEMLAWATEDARRDDEERLEEALASLTGERDGEVLAAQLADVGVPAHVVEDLAGIADDAHLAAREYWQTVDQLGVGRKRYSGAPVRFVGTPSKLTRAPALGEHTIPILCDLLALGESDIRALMQEGVLA